MQLGISPVGQSISPNVSPKKLGIFSTLPQQQMKGQCHFKNSVVNIDPYQIKLSGDNDDIDNIDLAKEEYDDALKDEENGAYQSALEKYQSWLTHYEKVDSMKESIQDVYYHTGVCHESLGDNNKALESYKKVTNTDRHSNVAHIISKIELDNEIKTENRRIKTDLPAKKISFSVTPTQSKSLSTITASTPCSRDNAYVVPTVSPQYRSGEEDLYFSNRKTDNCPEDSYQKRTEMIHDPKTITRSLTCWNTASSKMKDALMRLPSASFNSGAFWVPYASQSEFESTKDSGTYYTSYKGINEGGYYWVLYKNADNLMDDTQRFSVRTSNWSESYKEDIADIPISNGLPFTPKNNAHWVPYPNEESVPTHYDSIKTVNRFGYCWALYDKDNIPPGETYYKARTAPHASKSNLDIQLRPTYLPKRQDNFVWVPYPSKRCVPSDLIFRESLSGIFGSDNIYWVCHSGSSYVEDGEIYFNCRNQSYAMEYRVTQLPSSLPRISVNGSDTPVWVVYPNDASLPRGATFYKKILRDGKQWVLHSNKDTILEGEPYFPMRDKKFSSLLGVSEGDHSYEVLKLPTGPENANWVPFPSESHIPTELKRIKTYHHNNIVWVLANKESIGGDLCLGEGQYKTFQRDLLSSSDPRCRLLPPAPEYTVWEPYQSEEYIPNGVTHYKAYFKLKMGGLLWVLYPKTHKEHLSYAIPSEKTTQLSKLNISSLPVDLPPVSSILDNVGWVPYPKNMVEHMHGYYTAYKITKGDVSWLLFNQSDIFPGESYFLPRQSFANQLGIESAPKTLPRVTNKDAVWVPYPTKEIRDAIIPSHQYYTDYADIYRDGVYWVLHKNSDSIPKNEDSFKCREVSYIDHLAIQSLPVSLPVMPHGTVWVPFPSEDDIPPNIEYYLNHERQSVFWVAFESESKVPLNEPFFKSRSLNNPAYQDLKNRGKKDALESGILFNQLSDIEEVWGVSDTEKLASEISKKLPKNASMRQVNDLLDQVAFVKDEESKKAIKQLIQTQPISTWADAAQKIKDKELHQRAKILERPIEETIQLLKQLNPKMTQETCKRLLRQFNSINSIQKERAEWSRVQLSRWVEQRMSSHRESIEMDIAMLSRCVAYKMGLVPLNTQLLSILLNHAEDRSLQQMLTGEGKSLVIAMRAILQSWEKKTVDIITSSEILAVRDSEEYYHLYSFCGVSVGHNIPPKDESLFQYMYRDRVVYGTSSSNQFDILRSFSDDKHPRNKRMFDVCIVDEVDSMLVDSGGYIAYLSSEVKGMDRIKWLYHYIWSQVKMLEGKSKKDAVSIVTDKIKTDCAPHIPLFLKEFSDNKCGSWIESAYSAMYKNECGKEYIVGSDEKGKSEIKCVDYRHTGVVQDSRHYSDGLHQFLQIKESVTLKPEQLTTAYLSNVSFFNFYKSLYGITGTLGTDTEQAQIKMNYNTTFCNMPSRFNKIELKSENDTFKKDKHDWMSEISNRVRTEVKKGRPVLVLFETIKETEYFKKEYCPSSRLFNGKESEIERRSTLSNAGRQGQVTVATNISGRGIDIKTTEEVEQYGGLHLIITFMPENDRVERQALGRTARQGKGGSCSFVICSDRSVESARMIRDYAVDVANKYRESVEIPKAKAMDAIYLDMIQFVNSTARFRKANNKMPSIFNALLGTAPFVYEKDILTGLHAVKAILQEYHNVKDDYELEGIKMRWAMWVTQLKSNDQCVRNGSYDTGHLFRLYNEFKNQLSNDIKNNNIIQHPYLYIDRANDLFLSGKYKDAICDYNRAIKLDKGCSTAYYMRTLCYIKMGAKKAEIIKHIKSAKAYLDSEKESVNNIIKFDIIGVDKSQFKDLLDGFSTQIDMLDKVSELVSNVASDITAEIGASLVVDAIENIGSVAVAAIPLVGPLISLSVIGYKLKKVSDKYNADKKLNQLAVNAINQS
jgi:preprotein translocase subunit SecA